MFYPTRMSTSTNNNGAGGMNNGQGNNNKQPQSANIGNLSTNGKD